MKGLSCYIQESILDDDEKVADSMATKAIVELILSGQAKKKDLDSLKDKVAVWKPEDCKKLRRIVKLCTIIDSKCSLNWIDVSGIEDMSFMFSGSSFNGDVSKWDVSKVEDMSYMFLRSSFNGDISKWDVSKVKEMTYMFVKSKFNQDISKWKINSECRTLDMFQDCPIKDEYKSRKNETNK